MDDAYFEELDHQDIERIEEENEAAPGPDEAEEAPTTVREVKPKKIVVKPRLKLDAKRLKGPRGLSILEPLFKDVKFRGPGYERRDLDTVMSLLEHWAHRLFPKMTFEDCLEKIEDLGHKKIVSSYVTLLRMGCAEEADATEEQNEGLVRSRSPSPQRDVDPFDQLLDRPVQSQLTQEQRDRMERNQLIALERRRARLKAKYEKNNSSNDKNINEETILGTSLHSDNAIAGEEVLEDHSVPVINSFSNNPSESILRDINGRDTLEDNVSNTAGETSESTVPVLEATSDNSE